MALARLEPRGKSMIIVKVCVRVADGEAAAVVVDDLPLEIFDRFLRQPLDAHVHGVV